jgi:hypothetical protein
MDATKQAEWERKFRDAVQPKLDEPVLACGLFYRTGGYASIAMGPLSPLAGLVASGIGKKRAAGLPKQFLIAVTPTKVHAFKSAQGYGGVKAKDEVAVWDRGTITVTSEPTSLNTKVTIESADEDERIVCSTGKDEFCLAVIRAMQEPMEAAPLV